ncbi:DUF1877 family protein [Kitasatospora sp. NPDC048239]|uniref:DUF1877 family protein n=1 Tax=Kitasatospora sp. NPDC048239 TaxID=3364046 RepID=UPI00371D4606
MSIEFTMWRITPETYRQALDTRHLDGVHTAEDGRIAKGWSVLLRLLTPPGAGPLAGAAITGGVVLEDGEDADYGGTRMHAPEEVAAIAAELQGLAEEEIRRRCATVDLTGCHGAEDGVLLDPPERYVRHFRELRDFYTASAAERAAMVVWLG